MVLSQIMSQVKPSRIDGMIDGCSENGNEKGINVMPLYQLVYPFDPARIDAGWTYSAVHPLHTIDQQYAAKRSQGYPCYSRQWGYEIGIGDTESEDYSVSRLSLSEAAEGRFMARLPGKQRRLLQSAATTALALRLCDALSVICPAA